MTINPRTDLRSSDAKELLRLKEGFREQPYWDVNAWRVGYGSDTITREDGAVVRVQPGMRVSRVDAERDLDRRVRNEYMPAAIEAIGQDGWTKLSPAAQAVMVSLSYNYGAGAWKTSLNGVAVAAQSGDPQRIASAIRGLAGHNNGVNASRRNSEADMVLNVRGSGGYFASLIATNPEYRKRQVAEGRAYFAAREQRDANGARRHGKKFLTEFEFSDEMADSLTSGAEALSDSLAKLIGFLLSIFFDGVGEERSPNPALEARNQPVGQPVSPTPTPARESPSPVSQIPGLRPFPRAANHPLKS